MASPLPALGDMAAHSARFAQLAKEFLSEVAAAEDAYGRAMQRASSGLVAGLLSKPFEGASTQRQALVALSRMSTISYGEGAPLEDNGTADGRAMNRRVEIVVLN